AAGGGGSQRARGAHPPHRGVEVELGIADDPGPARPDTFGGLEKFGVRGGCDDDRLLPIHGEVAAPHLWGAGAKRLRGRAGGAVRISRLLLEKHPQVTGFKRLTLLLHDTVGLSLTYLDLVIQDSEDRALAA